MREKLLLLNPCVCVYTATTTNVHYKLSLFLSLSPCSNNNCVCNIVLEGIIIIVIRTLYNTIL